VGVVFSNGLCLFYPLGWIGPSGTTGRPAAPAAGRCAASPSTKIIN
jgi:hypothetical protein